MARTATRPAAVLERQLGKMVVETIDDVCSTFVEQIALGDDVAERPVRAEAREAVVAALVGVAERHGWSAR